MYTLCKGNKKKLKMKKNINTSPIFVDDVIQDTFIN